MKLSFYISIAITSLAILGLNSCKSEAETVDDILTGNFYVRYLEKGTTERVEAHLFLVDTAQNKTPYVLPSGILQESTKMSSKWISDKLHRYQIEKQGPFRELLNFEFTDLNGNQLTNSISMRPIQNLNLPELINLEEKVGLDFSNNPLLKNEKISILLNNEAGKTKVISIVGPQNSEYTIDLAENDLEKGEWTYYFVKRQETKSEGPNIFLLNAYEYYSSDRQLVIK